jgi:hypothetical protein
MGACWREAPKKARIARLGELDLGYRVLVAIKQT